MSRKPLYENLVSVHVRLEPIQKDLLIKKATEAGITVTDLIRQLIKTLETEVE